jgi:hypothetical protein
MGQSLRSKLVAGTVGAAVIGGLATLGGIIMPAVESLASETAPEAVMPVLAPPALPGKALATDLVKVDGDYYAIGTEPGVSLEADDSSVIRKIAYGRTSFVTVATTESGVYSSEALTNPHVRYPGIYVDPLRLHFFPSGKLLGWSRLTGWTSIPLLDAHSFGFLDSNAPPASQDGVCVSDTEAGGCR